MVVFTNPGTEFAHGIEFYDFIEIIGISPEEGIDYIERNPDTIRMVDDDEGFFEEIEESFQPWLDRAEQDYWDELNLIDMECNQTDYFFEPEPGEQLELFPDYDIPF